MIPFSQKVDFIYKKISYLEMIKNKGDNIEYINCL